MRKILVGLILVSLWPGWLSAGQITMKGSDTMVRLAQRWAEEYMKSHRSTTVQVSGGGSLSGISALLNGTTTICMASRDLSSQEYEIAKAKGIDVNRVPVALDAIAIYLHKGNPVTQLSIAQLREIYTDQITNWKDLGGHDHKIILYGRENNSGTYTFFKEHVLLKEDYADRCEPLPGTASVVNAIAHDRFGIGYGGVAWTTTIKYAAIKATDSSEAILPKVEDVVAGEYPLSRELCFFLNGVPTGEAKDFIEWALSSEGRKITAKTDYIPLKGSDDTNQTKQPGK